MTPTPQQIVETLVEAIGTDHLKDEDGVTYACVGDRGETVIVFSPLDSMDSMAIVEAHIYRSPQDYQVYYALREQLAIKAWKFDYSPTMNQLRCAVDVQPASVRALAAYQLLKGKE